MIGSTRRAQRRHYVAAAVITVVATMFATGAMAQEPVQHGISLTKGCVSPTKIGDPYTCSYTIQNNVDDAEDTLTINGLTDIVHASGGDQDSGNIFSTLKLVVSGGATCTGLGITGAGTLADPYTGATLCTLPFGSRIDVQPVTHYTVQAGDFALAEHKLPDDVALDWQDLCDDPAGTENSNCSPTPAPATAASLSVVEQLVSATVTVIHDAGHAPVTSVPVGTIVHDSVLVTGEAGKPTPTGTVTFQFFTNSTCTGDAFATSGPVALDGSGAADATAFPQGPLAVGQYGFKATYGGDAAYIGSVGACEPLAVIGTPHIHIDKAPDLQTVAIGSTVTWTIVVTNDGNVPLTNVTVTDAQAPGCNRTSAQIPALATMAPGAQVTYQCSLANVTASFTNVAVATGTGPLNETVTDDDDAQVVVVDAYIDINPPSATNQVGTTHTFTAHVFVNTGSGVFVDAPNGTVVNFAFVGAHVGSFTAGSTCTVASGGSCPIVITSPNPGLDTMQATTTLSVGGVPLTRTTGTPAPGHANSANATKLWVGTPHIRIDKSPDDQNVQSGSTVSWTIVVTNDGNVTLTDVIVTDAQAPGCNRTKADIPALASMAVGAQVSYQCSRANVTAAFTNVAVTVGTPPEGPNVTDDDDARVTVFVPVVPTPPVVTHPSIHIEKTPDDQTVPSGANVSWTIVVTNNGDVTLTNVTVTDAEAPGCARTRTEIPALASMAPGAAVTYQCARNAVTASFTNVAVTTGTPPSGPNVTDDDDARVTVIHPAIRIVKNPKLQTVRIGGTARFTITVTNTGDVTLTNVRVTDFLSPRCNRRLGTMEPGATRTYTCTRLNVRANYTNVAIVVGTPPFGPNVTDRDTARVRVVIPPKPKVIAKKKPKVTG